MLNSEQRVFGREKTTNKYGFFKLERCEPCEPIDLKERLDFVRNRGAKIINLKSQAVGRKKSGFGNDRVNSFFLTAGHQAKIRQNISDEDKRSEIPKEGEKEDENSSSGSERFRAICQAIYGMKPIGTCQDLMSEFNYPAEHVLEILSERFYGYSQAELTQAIASPRSIGYSNGNGMRRLTFFVEPIVERMENGKKKGMATLSIYLDMEKDGASIADEHPEIPFAKYEDFADLLKNIYQTERIDYVIEDFCTRLQECLRKYPECEQMANHRLLMMKTLLESRGKIPQPENERDVQGDIRVLFDQFYVIVKILVSGDIILEKVDRTMF